MQSLLKLVLALFLPFALAGSVVAEDVTQQPAPRTLRTEFICKISIPTIPTGARSVSLWVPVPANSEWQHVESVQIEGAPASRITREPRFGNRMLYVHVDRLQQPVTATVRYTVSRREFRVLAARPHNPHPLTEAQLAPYLAAEPNLPVGGRFLTISEGVTAGQISVRDKARALYEHVVRTMQYDYKQESPEFGQGDAAFVCDYKRGDCADLHSYLMSLMRTQQIPVVHEFGFPVTGVPLADPLPAEAKVSSYHCYACFYDPAYGWVPVDASDAIRWNDHQRPEMQAVLFGNQVLERNAVVISRGRNLVLAPPQQGAPVNKFVYPYAEADGKPIPVAQEMTRRLLPSGK